MEASSMCFLTISSENEADPARRWYIYGYNRYSLIYSLAHQLPSVPETDD